MIKNERYTREIQRLREENAELKELYATYRERCEEMALFVERLQNELTQLKANRDELQNS